MTYETHQRKIKEKGLTHQNNCYEKGATFSDIANALTPKEARRVALSNKVWAASRITYNFYGNIHVEITCTNDYSRHQKIHAEWPSQMVILNSEFKKELIKAHNLNIPTYY